MYCRLKTKFNIFKITPLFTLRKGWSSTLQDEGSALLVYLRVLYIISL